MRLFIDCGAPSIYNKLSKRPGSGHQGAHMKYRRYDDFAYTDTAEYKQYRRRYAKFLRTNKQGITEYPNLDVINNPELTYKNQKWLEARGLTPLPVWHIGGDISWLLRYLDEGYKHICLGGMTPNPTSTLIPILDNLWLKYLLTDDMKPRIKVHGFAVTSFKLMARYPWYSVDSTSWMQVGINGNMLIPYNKGGVWRYDIPPLKIGISSRHPKIGIPGEHLNTLPPRQHAMVMSYLECMGCVFGESTYEDGKEIQVVRGITNDWEHRCFWNALFYAKYADSLPWPRTAMIKSESLL